MADNDIPRGQLRLTIAVCLFQPHPRHMTTLLITHDVDDVEHWLASPKREEYFGPRGITMRTYVDAERSNHVGLIIEVPDMETLQQALATPEAADAMKHLGPCPWSGLLRRGTGSVSDSRLSRFLLCSRFCGGRLRRRDAQPPRYARQPQRALGRVQ
jgi:hypothetical protein